MEPRDPRRNRKRRSGGLVGVVRIREPTAAHWQSRAFVLHPSQTPRVQEESRHSPPTLEAQRKTVTASPENSETPLDSAPSWVTPNRLFFVRNHFDVPRTDPATWKLTLEGLVARPRSWSFAELAAMPQHSVFATVECAGNGRSFLREKAAGVQWGAGAIGHAEWTGVRLRDLLEPAGLNPSALEVVFEGADRGTEPDHPAPMFFSRSLPLAKALDPDTLIALRMNGELLDGNHGAPLRLFVPGWYGVASVKWLRTIRVIDHAYPGYFQTNKYSIDRTSAGGKRRMPLGPGVVKSEILYPAANATLPLGAQRIAGIAWAGEERIARVDVSTDGGISWQPAQLSGLRQPYSWCRWEYDWRPGAEGEHTLLARAHTDSGQSQPFEYNSDNLGYLINVVLPRTVRVQTAAPTAVRTDAIDWIETMQDFAVANTRRGLDIELALTGGEGI
jgi:DMSO/TMAO reductase YedYZ molybdopterin-dependent catalytic subunit